MGQYQKKVGQWGRQEMFNHHEQEICSELWKVFKKHYDDQTKEQAENALNELIEVCQKYDNSQFCRDMALAMNSQLMVRWKENHPEDQIDWEEDNGKTD